jgi:hypothetical protein
VDEPRSGEDVADILGEFCIPNVVVAALTMVSQYVQALDCGN